MTGLSEFIPHIAPDVPGCPEPMIEDRVRLACIQFCEGSEYLRERFTVATIPGADSVALAPATGAVVKVDAVAIDGEDLDKSRRSDFPTDTNSGQPAKYYLEEGGTLRLHPVPDVAYTLTIEAAVAPDEDAATVPDILYKKHRHAIAAGAKAMLMAMKKQPWTDYEAAAVNAQAFAGAISKARSSKAKGGVGAPLRTRAHYF